MPTGLSGTEIESFQLWPGYIRFGFGENDAVFPAGTCLRRNDIESGGSMARTPPSGAEDDFEDTIADSTQRSYPVSPPSSRLLVKRKGHSITRQIPKPVVLVDTREKTPFEFDRFTNWVAGTKQCKLDVGDYSVEGMEEILALERKTLSDLITTVMQERTRFFRMCERMSQYRWRALILEASYEDIKSPYDEDYTLAHPNAVSGTLDALEARFGIPIIYASRYRGLAEEKAASWLSKHFTYWYLETEVSQKLNPV